MSRPSPYLELSISRQPLPSINHRIALLYGENYGLTIESSPEKGTTVTIVIPDKKI